MERSEGMSPRTGRPPKADARHNDINIRINEKEKADIEYVANYYHISRTDALLRGIAKLMEEIKEQ